MSLHRSQGRARVQVARADELPSGVPASPPAPARPADRDHAGRFTKGNRTSALGAKSKAAKERAARPRLLRLGGMLPELEVDRYFAPFREESERWLRAKVEELGRDVGGGVVGAGVLAILEGAAWDRAQGRFLREVSSAQGFAWVVDGTRKPGALPRLDLIAAASRLDAEFTRKLVAAHELASREAAARPKAPSWYALPSAPLPSTTTTSASARDDVAPDSATSGNALDVTTDDEDGPRSREDGRTAHDDEDEGEEQATRTSAPTRHVEPAFDPAPWMPVPELKPHAEQWFRDMKQTAAEHPLSFRASLLPRTTAMQRRGALTEEHVQAVVRWLAQPWNPPAPTK